MDLNLEEQEGVRDEHQTFSHYRFRTLHSAILRLPTRPPTRSDGLAYHAKRKKRKSSNLTIRTHFFHTLDPTYPSTGLV